MGSPRRPEDNWFVKADSVREKIVNLGGLSEEDLALALLLDDSVLYEFNHERNVPDRLKACVLVGLYGRTVSRHRYSLFSRFAVFESSLSAEHGHSLPSRYLTFLGTAARVEADRKYPCCSSVHDSQMLGKHSVCH
jgi:hypothetical protein